MASNNNIKYILLASIVIYMTVCGQTFVVPGPCAQYKTRASSYPYISGDTFRSFCNFVIDETQVPFDPSQVSSGDVIFLKTDYIDYFFTQIHPHIKVRYILLTHNGDYGVTERHRHYLEHETLIAWFAQNALIKHPKLIPIPIGLANRYWGHGDINIVNRFMKNQPTKRTIFVYANFALNTNMKERKEAEKSLSTHISQIYHAPRKAYDKYLQDLTNATFVLSPPGNGFDCHRTWEALYMGAIPIVKSSAMDGMYQDLPVIVVDDWNCITQEFLGQEYQKIKITTYNREKLYADYWVALIRSLQVQEQS